MAEIKSQNWFRRHWIISIFLGLFVLGIVGSLFDDSEKNLTGNVVNEQSGNEEDIRFSLESILPEMKNFPTEYTRGDIENIEESDGNLKAYDTNQGFVNGKKFYFSKYELGYSSVTDYFDVAMMLYEFKNQEDAVNFKKEIENFMENQGGYSEVNLNVKGNCFNTKEDFGYSGGNIVSSVCQKDNVIYWTELSVTNSFKDSEDFIKDFIDVIEANF